MNTRILNYLPQYKKIELKTSQYLIRYHQNRHAKSVTDGIFIWTHENKSLICIYDMNNFPPHLAEDLINGAADIMKKIFYSSGSLLDCFYAGRAFIGNWVDQEGVSIEQRFINPGLLMVDGDSISFTGAYFPIYNVGDNGIELHLFNGTVWGINGLSDFYVETETIKVENCAYILSSGMLESRNSNGDINGDSLLRKVYQEPGYRMSNEQFERIKQIYIEEDVERLNSHSLLLIERIREDIND